MFFGLVPDVKSAPAAKQEVVNKSITPLPETKEVRITKTQIDTLKKHALDCLEKANQIKQQQQSHKSYEYCLQAAFYYQAANVLAKENELEKEGPVILKELAKLDQKFPTLAFETYVAEKPFNTAIDLKDGNQVQITAKIDPHAHKKILIDIRELANKQLKTYREQFDPKVSVSSSKPLTMQTIYKDITCQIKKLFIKIINESVTQYKNLTKTPPPCDYVFIALGSLAREEITPYSDLEFGLIIEDKQDKGINEKNKIYFRDLCRLINFNLLALGETPASALGIKMPIIDGKVITNPVRKGICFDACVPGGYKNPLGKRDAKGEIVFELIGTPTELADYQDEKYYNENGKLKDEPFLPGSLAHSCSISIEAKLSERKLLDDYQSKVTKKLNEHIKNKSLRERRALKLLYIDLERFQLKLGRHEADKLLFSAKHDFYRLPNTIIDHLALYYGKKELSLWDRVECLTEVFKPEFAKKIQMAIDIIVEMRLAIYLDAEEQKEITEFKGFADIFSNPNMHDEKNPAYIKTPNKKYQFRVKDIFTALSHLFWLQKLANNFCDNPVNDNLCHEIKELDSQFVRARSLDLLCKKKEAISVYNTYLKTTDEQSAEHEECLVHKALANFSIEEELQGVHDFTIICQRFNNLNLQHLDKQLKFARYAVLFAPLLAKHNFFNDSLGLLEKAELIFKHQLGSGHPEYNELCLTRVLVTRKKTSNGDQNIQENFDKRLNLFLAELTEKLGGNLKKTENDKSLVQDTKQDHSKVLPPATIDEKLNINAFALGNSDYKSVIEQKGLLIDKTLFIKEVIDDKTQVKLIIRPRRFGKTLNMSMLKYFFKTTKKEHEHAELFTGKAIWRQEEKYRSEQGQYPVIFISFKEITSNDLKEIYDEIKYALSGLYSKYKEMLFEKNIIKVNTLEQKDYDAVIERKAEDAIIKKAYKKLTEHLHKAYRKKVIVLIDEYDTPIQLAYMSGSSSISAITELISNILKPLLTNNNCIYRAILTGTYLVVPQSVFSNDVCVDHVLSPQCSKYFGFSRAEIELHLGDLATKDLLVNLESWYGGYQMGAIRQFEPGSVTNFIHDNVASLSSQSPFYNYWLNIGDNAYIENLIMAAEISIKKQLKNLSEKKAIFEKIDANTVFANINKDQQTLWSFLLLSGCLTIRPDSANNDEKRCGLIIPNQSLLEYYERLLKRCLEDEKKLASKAGIVNHSSVFSPAKQETAAHVNVPSPQTLDNMSNSPKLNI